MSVDAESILARFAFYRGLAEEDRVALRRSAVVVRLEPGAVFYSEGDEVPKFALVGTGSIRVFKASETGREITLYHVADGQTCLVNMLCVFLGRRAVANAVVESPLTAAVLPAAPLRELVRRSDAVRDFVFESIAMRMVDVMTLTEEIAFRKVDQRLSAHLLARFDNHGAPVTEIAVTHEEIAAELGTAREVVSRLLKELERAGAVSLARGRIQLQLADTLRLTAGGGVLP